MSEVLDLVQSFKIRLAIQSPWLIEALSREAGAILMRDYESEYMAQEEMEENGAQAVGSANLGGIQSVEALAPLLLAEESIFGVASKYSETALAAKCDFCFLAVNFNRVKVDPRARIATTHDVGTVQVHTLLHSLPSLTSNPLTINLPVTLKLNIQLVCNIHRLSLLVPMYLALGRNVQGA